MKCFNGIPVDGQLVPCGRCLDCRINKGREWSSRILMEHVAGNRGYFFTWTYDDEHLPRTEQENLPTLRKKAFQRWLEKRRESTPLRFYAVGEYGDDTFRPHYHAAIFPRGNWDPRELLVAWKQGTIKSVRDLNARRARYLANYTAKKLTKDTDERLRDGQEPEFRSSSRTPGLGVPFVPTLVSAYRTRAGQKIIEECGDIERTVRFYGKVYPIPRFILDKVRVDLGIPVKHSDRLLHPGYYERYAHKPLAERDKEKSLCRRMKVHGEITQKRRRSRTQSI